MGLKRIKKPDASAGSSAAGKFQKEWDGVHWDNKPLQEKFKTTLESLKPGSQVAVITMAGSCCPVTRAHCMAFEVARDLLKERTQRTQQYAEILGALSLNSDNYVWKKLAKKDDDEIIHWSDRAMLVQLATEEIPWLSVSFLREKWVLWDLKKSWTSINFVQYHLNGADDVLKYEKWTRAVDAESRFIAMGRPGYTEELKKLAAETPFFFIGPELPDISSSQVRAALYEEDLQSLEKLLHHSVTSWCLTHSPYRRCKRRLQPDVST